MVVELEVVLQVELEVELEVEDDDEEEEKMVVVEMEVEPELEVEVELRTPPCGTDGLRTWPTKTAPRAERRRASPAQLGVPSLPGAVLRHLHLQELRPHALDLLLRHGPDVEGPDDGAHVLGRLDDREARNTHLKHKDLGGGDLRSERR